MAKNVSFSGVDGHVKWPGSGQKRPESCPTHFIRRAKVSAFKRMHWERLETKRKRKNIFFPGNMTKNCVFLVKNGKKMTYFGGGRPCQMAVEWPEMVGIMPYTLHSKRKGLSFQTHTFGACKNKKKRNKHIFRPMGPKNTFFLLKNGQKWNILGFVGHFRWPGSGRKWPESCPTHFIRRA